MTVTEEGPLRGHYFVNAASRSPPAWAPASDTTEYNFARSVLDCLEAPMAATENSSEKALLKIDNIHTHGFLCWEVYAVHLEICLPPFDSHIYCRFSFKEV